MGTKFSLKRLISKKCPCLSKKYYSKIISSEEETKQNKQIQILQI